MRRPARGNVRDHIGSHKSDHRPSYPPYSGLQRRRQPKTDLGEIFGAAQLSTFSTISTQTGRMMGRANLPQSATSRPAFLRNRFRKAEFTRPRYQSSGVSPAAPPHSIGTNRG